MPATKEAYDIAQQIMMSGNIDQLSDSEAEEVLKTIQEYEAPGQVQMLSDKIRQAPSTEGMSGVVESPMEMQMIRQAQAVPEGAAGMPITDFAPSPQAPSPSTPGQALTAARQPISPEVASLEMGKYDLSLPGGIPVPFDPNAYDAPSMMAPAEGADSLSHRSDVYFPSKVQGSDPLAVPYTHFEPSLSQVKDYFRRNPELVTTFALSSEEDIQEGSEAYNWYADAWYKHKAEDWLAQSPDSSVWRPALEQGKARSIGKAVSFLSPKLESFIRGALPGMRFFSENVTDPIVMGAMAGPYNQALRELAETEDVELPADIPWVGDRINPMTAAGGWVAPVPIAAGALAAGGARQAAGLGTRSVLSGIAEGAVAGAAGGAAEAGLSAMDYGAVGFEPIAQGMLQGAILGGALGGYGQTRTGQGTRLRNDPNLGRHIRRLEEGGGELGVLWNTQPEGMRATEIRGEFQPTVRKPTASEMGSYEAARVLTETGRQRANIVRQNQERWLTEGLKADINAGRGIRAADPFPWLKRLEDTARQRYGEPLAQPVRKVFGDAVKHFYDVRKVKKADVPSYTAQGAIPLDPRQHPWLASLAKENRLQFAGKPQSTLQQMQQALANADAGDGYVYVVNRKRFIDAEDANAFTGLLQDRLSEGSDFKLKQLHASWLHGEDGLRKHFPGTAAARNKIHRAKSEVERDYATVTGKEKTGIRPEDFEGPVTMDLAERRAGSELSHSMNLELVRMERGAPEFGFPAVPGLEQTVADAAAYRAANELGKPINPIQWKYGMIGAFWNNARMRLDALERPVRNPSMLGRAGAAIAPGQLTLSPMELAVPPTRYQEQENERDGKDQVRRRTAD